MSRLAVILFPTNRGAYSVNTCLKLSFSAVTKSKKAFTRP
jgi:hypothetical protein